MSKLSGYCREMHGRIGLVFCSVFLQIIGKCEWPRAKSGLLVSKLAKPVGAWATSQVQLLPTHLPLSLVGRSV